MRLVKTGTYASTFFSTYPVAREGECLKTPTASQRIALLDNRYVEQGKSLGIPGNDALSTKRFSETFVRAGAPMVLDVLSAGAEFPIRSQCRATAVWTPEMGMDYEAALNWTKEACQLTVSVISQEGESGNVQRHSAHAEYLQPCGK